MTKEQAGAIVDVLHSLVVNSEQYWLKISAAEHILKNHSQELWNAYQFAIDRQQNSPKILNNHEESARTLEVLRKTLSTEQG